MFQAIGAIAYVHLNGFMHCDIKPEKSFSYPIIKFTKIK